MDKSSSTQATINVASHIKIILTVLFSSLAIITGIFLISGYGYMVGYSETFNYLFNFSDTSALNLHMLGLYVFSKEPAFLILLLLLILLGVIIQIYIMPPRARNKNKPEKVSSSKLFYKIWKHLIDSVKPYYSAFINARIIYLVYIFGVFLLILCVLFVQFGVHTGARRATNDLRRYYYAFTHKKIDILNLDGEISISNIENKQLVKYLGFIVNNSSQRIVIYAIKDHNKKPAIYMLNYSSIQNMTTHPLYQSNKTATSKT